MGSVQLWLRLRVGASSPISALGASMTAKWFKHRAYRHFDVAVGEDFAAKICNAQAVASHSWLPLIHYVKKQKRYKPNTGKTQYKARDIMFASHRDACILSKYAFDISNLLDQLYGKSGLHDNVIAYRRLGRSNYHFSAAARDFARKNSPCAVLCFDITGFFDNLDHKILKDRLKSLLMVSELPDDWHRVLRHVTKYRRVNRDDLADHPIFKTRLSGTNNTPIATISELKAEKISIHSNKNCYGIPQGSPISSVLSNLYMFEVDVIMRDACLSIGAMYQRYSDDILIVCPLEHEDHITLLLKLAVAAHKLEIKDEKTERAIFRPDGSDSFQYLGFNISGKSTVIRPSSLARQWRKAKLAIKMTKLRGKEAVLSGTATEISAKRLRQRFWPTGAQNFSRYARRAAAAFRSKKMVRQVLRLERMVDREIRDINK